MINPRNNGCVRPSFSENRLGDHSIYLIPCRCCRWVCRQASKRNGLFQNRSELRSQNQQVFRYIKFFRNYNRFASMQKARSFVTTYLTNLFLKINTLWFSLPADHRLILHQGLLNRQDPFFVPVLFCSIETALVR